MEASTGVENKEHWASVPLMAGTALLLLPEGDPRLPSVQPALPNLSSSADTPVKGPLGVVSALHHPSTFSLHPGSPALPLP